MKIKHKKKMMRKLPKFRSKRNLPIVKSNLSDENSRSVAHLSPVERTKNLRVKSQDP